MSYYLAIRVKRKTTKITAKSDTLKDNLLQQIYVFYVFIIFVSSDQLELYQKPLVHSDVISERVYLMLQAKG